MSIQKIGKKQYVGVCDVCGTKTRACTTIQECSLHMKELEWSARKERPDDWVNICNDCKEAIYE